MSFREGDNISAYLDNMMNTCNDVGKTIRRIVAARMKKDVVSQLNAVRYFPKNKDGSPGKRPREIHMADDVHIVTTKDKFGYEVTKVQGGKKTGPLWHLVNDGVYEKAGNHFMDNTLNRADDFIDKSIDDVMRKEGF